MMTSYPTDKLIRQAWDLIKRGDPNLIGRRFLTQHGVLSRSFWRRPRCWVSSPASIAQPAQAQDAWAGIMTSLSGSAATPVSILR